MKKIISVLLAALFMISVVSINASAMFTIDRISVNNNTLAEMGNDVYGETLRTEKGDKVYILGWAYGENGSNLKEIVYTIDGEEVKCDDNYRDRPEVAATFGLDAALGDHAGIGQDDNAFELTGIDKLDDGTYSISIIAKFDDGTEEIYPYLNTLIVGTGITETKLLAKSFDTLYVNGEMKANGNTAEWLDNNVISGAVRSLRICGWAYLNKNIYGFAYSVDGGGIRQNYEYKVDRPDVKEAISEKAEGFDISVSLQTLGKGNHTLKVFALDSDYEYFDIGIEIPFIITEENTFFTGTISSNENITWTFDLNTREAVISGTGDMESGDFWFEPDYKEFLFVLDDCCFDMFVKKVTINPGITSIRSGAFYGFCSLEEIIIPDTVKKIGDMAFYDCDRLERIVLPSGITEYGGLMFEGCDNLKEVVPDIMTGSAGEGVTFKAQYSTGTLTFSGKGEVEEGYYRMPKADNDFEPWVVLGDKTKTVIFEEGIKGIGSNSLRKLKNVEDVYLASTMKFVEYGNFSNMDHAVIHNAPAAVLEGYYDCFGWVHWIIDPSTGIMTLESTNIEPPEGAQTAYSEEGLVWQNFSSLIKKVVFKTFEDVEDFPSFQNLFALEEIVLPDDLQSFNTTFYGCKSLKKITIPDAITDINRSMFAHCPSLETVHLGKNVNYVGAYAFEGATGLVSFTVDEENAEFKSVDGVLYTKDGKTLVAYPASKPGSSYTVPEGVETISGSAFWGAQNLEKVILPEGLTVIGNYAFSNAFKLKSADLPESLENLGSGAFWGAAIEKAYISENVEYIGTNPFNTCGNLKEITVSKNNAYYTSVNGVLFNNSVTELISYPIGNEKSSYATPKTVTAICECAFQNCNNLHNLTLNDGLTVIYNYAFNKCTSLTTLTLPVSLNRINFSAFNMNHNLHDIYYKNGMLGLASISTGIYNDNLFYTDIKTKAPETGDCNGDGVVNNKDVVKLFKLVSEGTEYSIVYDLNNDGVVNNKDVVLLFRKVSES